MSRRILISGLLGMAFAPFAALFGYLQTSYRDEVRRMPKYHAYLPTGTFIHGALASYDNDECMAAISEYHQRHLLEPNESGRLIIPECFDFAIEVNAVVSLIEMDPTGKYAKIGYFYIGHNKREHYKEGYILKEALHDMPLNKDQSL